MFRMLPEKVGPARKILTYLKREQKQYKGTLQLPSQDTQGVDSNVFGSTSSSKSNQPTRKTQVDDSNEASGSTSYTKISQPPCSNSVSVIQSPKQYIFSTLDTFFIFTCMIFLLKIGLF